MIKIVLVFLGSIVAGSIENGMEDSCTSLGDSNLQREAICQKTSNNILKCSSHRILSILTCYCITNSSTGLVEVGKCTYNNLPDLTPYKELPHCEANFTEVMCKNFNRKGTLCGECRDGYYPLAYSFDLTCVECPNGRTNWWKFVLVPFLPLTVLYLVVLLFKINIISSHLHGFFLYSQAIIIPEIARGLFNSWTIRSSSSMKLMLQFVATLYGIWNLDFFRSLDLGICLETDMLQTLALDALVGTYSLLLIILSYLLISLYDRNFKPLVVITKPFRAIFGLFRKNWNLRTSLIDAFLTFFVMSYVKFLSLASDLLSPVKVEEVNSAGNLTSSWRLFYNASVPYFGEKHLPYGILGAAVLLFFVLLPTILFTVYPFAWFQKLLNFFPFRWYILHTFMDSLHGCYKDGTQPGTRDCRWFASSFFIMRLLLMLLGMYTFNMMFFPFGSIILVSFTVFLINLDPFKETKNTITNSVFLLLLGISYTLPTVQDVTFLVHLLDGITVHVPLLYITVLTLHWIYSHSYRKFGCRWFNRHRNGYERLE